MSVSLCGSLRPCLLATYDRSDRIPSSGGIAAKCPSRTAPPYLVLQLHRDVPGPAVLHLVIALVRVHPPSSDGLLLCLLHALSHRHYLPDAHVLQGPNLVEPRVDHLLVLQGLARQVFCSVSSSSGREVCGDHEHS